MVDLKGQYNKIKKEVRDEMEKVIDNVQFINGDIVSEFQKNLEDFLNVKNVIPCGNGTDALQIAMMLITILTNLVMLLIFYRLRILTGTKYGHFLSQHVIFDFLFAMWFWITMILDRFYAIGCYRMGFGAITNAIASASEVYLVR